MFKSKIPLQTPLSIKLFLFAAIAISWVSWSTSSEASSQKFEQETKILAIKPESKRYGDEKLSQIAKLTHQQVNQYRASLNLAPLKFNALISEQAMTHSQNMAQQTVEFSHQDFQSRVEAVENNIAVGSAAENVAYNMGYQNPVATAVAGWIESDGHRKNLEGNYNLTGIGVAINPQGEYYFTQIFILEN